MKARLCALALVLLVPVGAGQTDSIVDDAHLVLSTPLALSQLYEYKGDSSTFGWPHGACNEMPGTDEPDHVHVHPDGGHFTFLEDEMENACAEARFLLDVPDGARQVAVSFRASRSIQSATSAPLAAPPNVEQTVRLYPGLDNVAAGIPAPVEFEVFSPATPTTPDMQDFVMRYDLPVDTTRLGVGWFFADHGASEYQQVVRPAFGQVVAAVVDEPQISFLGLSVATHESQRSIGLADGQRIFETTVELIVPAPSPQGGSSLEVALVSSFSVSGLTGPDGRAVTTMETSDENGRTRVLIPNTALAQHGPGVYQLRLLSTAPVETQFEMSMLFGAAVIFPAVAGIYAQQNVARLARLPCAKHSGQRVLQLGVIGTAMGLAALGAATLATGNLPLLFSWPFDQFSLVFYLLCLAVVLVFAGLANMARRRAMDAMATDIDERQRMEQELTRSNAELEQFAYVASHDLKEPLRMVAGYTQLLERRYHDQLDERARKYIDYASEGAARMQDMVDDLLAYSRVGQDDQVAEDVSLHDVVTYVLKQLAVTVEEANASIAVADLPVVRGDRGRLVQLVQNLLQNAVKFRAPDRPCKVTVSARRRGKRWVISVADNGIGMDTQHVERAFQIFQRLHARSDYEGNGIGLAICRKIVEVHGGQLQVQTKPGHGATFNFDLEAA